MHIYGDYMHSTMDKGLGFVEMRRRIRKGRTVQADGPWCLGLSCDSPICRVTSEIEDDSVLVSVDDESSKNEWAWTSPISPPIYT